MTRLAFLLIALMMGLPVAAWAETVGINSGDHNGFTRLVVQFRRQEDWVFGRVEGGFELRPGRDDITYRLDRVYRKITRTRIADVRDLADGRLFVAVDCNCHGRVEELSDGQVVLDIVTGTAREPGTGVNATLPPPFDPPEDALAAVPDAPIEGIIADDPPRKPVVVSDRAGLPLTLPRVGLPVALPRQLPKAAPNARTVDDSRQTPDVIHDSVIPPEPRGAPEPAEPPETPVTERATRIAETETALLEQVARAASQGLLDADLSQVEANVAEVRPRPVEEPAPEIQRPKVPVTPRGHVSVETSVDRAAGKRDPRGDETHDGDVCIDPRFFDIATWGEPVESGTDIGAYRARIVGEFDIADDVAVTALARKYVYITFGAEAQALIRRYPDSVDRADLVFVMAEIMDGGQSVAAADLVEQMSCDGATALWATLAQPSLRPGQAINGDAVALAFGDLPAHLRAHLGPGLAAKLLASGDRETADIVRAAVDRTGSAPTPDYGVMAAQFDLDAGRVVEATATLEDVVEQGDASMPEALLQRVEAILSRGGAVPQDIVALLDGLALQFRGTETARLMTDAGIRARASASDFAGAFMQLDAAKSADLLFPERSATLRAEVFERLTRDTSDTEFLRLALARLDGAATLPARVRHGLAARFLDLGLPDPARQALGDSGAMPKPTDRLLLARAALAEGQPAVAIGYLAGLGDLPALILRAEALDMARDYNGAMRAHEVAGNEAQTLRAAWRGGFWTDVVVLDHGPIGAAAGMMAAARHTEINETARSASEATTEAPAVEGRPGSTPRAADADREAQQPLAVAQALIDESATTRKVLAALLEEIESPATTSTPEDTER